MRTAEEWNDRYVTQDLPWDTGRRDQNLERLLAEFDIGPCSALELGCGTGTNAIWLAGRGFRVTALDISSLAIEKARSKAAKAGVAVDFRTADILEDGIPNSPFNFVFDRGCFHSFSEPKDRTDFADKVYQCLAPAAKWLSLIGSKDGPDREKGPPRWTALEIAQAVEARFEILHLAATHFDSDQPDPLRGWACLMRRR